MPHRFLPDSPVRYFTPETLNRLLKYLNMNKENLPKPSWYRQAMLFINKRGVKPPGMEKKFRITLVKATDWQRFEGKTDKSEVLPKNVKVFVIKGVEIKSYSRKAALKKYYRLHKN